ncbi:MAG: hypothetical protein E7379_01185 [Clostridiales bacterium]|nr:hypothetical protein [Clostridiales bacterium]
MKTPLRYQITEFDCGSVSLLNCITYLFKREEIPAELVKAISSYTLDCYDEFGNLGQKGTSREAVQYLSRWITNFSENKDFGIVCEYLSGNNVTLEKIKNCIKNKGCVNLRTYQGCEHYVSITDLDNEFVYIFDPYYYPESHYKNNNNIFYIADKPFLYNRKVRIQRFLSEQKYENALGPILKRECVLFNRK